MSETVLCERLQFKNSKGNEFKTWIPIFFVEMINIWMKISKNQSAPVNMFYIG